MRDTRYEMWDGWKKPQWIDFSHPDKHVSILSTCRDEIIQDFNGAVEGVEPWFFGPFWSSKKDMKKIYIHILKNHLVLSRTLIVNFID